MAIEDGYTPPTMTPTRGGEDVLKPKSQWSAQEFEASRGTTRQCMPSFMPWTIININ